MLFAPMLFERVQPHQDAGGDVFARSAVQQAFHEGQLPALVEPAKDGTVDDGLPELFDQIEHQGRLAGAVDVQKAGEGFQAGVHHGAPDMRGEDAVAVIQGGVDGVGGALVTPSGEAQAVRQRVADFFPVHVFALVTDGVAETGDNPDAERGLERVSDLLGRLHDRPLPDVASAVLAEATATGAQHDDATVLLLRCSGEAGIGQPEAAEGFPAREVIWSRQLDALEELLAREDKRMNKNETDDSR